MHSFTSSSLCILFTVHVSPKFFITISVIVRKLKHGFVSVSQFSVRVVILYPAAFTFYKYFTETISENGGAHERKVSNWI